MIPLNNEQRDKNAFIKTSSLKYRSWISKVIKMENDKDGLLPKLEEIKELIVQHYEIVLKCCEFEENIYNCSFSRSEAEEEIYNKFQECKQNIRECDDKLLEQTDSLISQYTKTGDMPFRLELEGLETIII